jgi:heme A synthase
MEIGWTDVESGGYILVSCAHSNTSYTCTFAVLVYIYIFIAPQKPLNVTGVATSDPI